MNATFPKAIVLMATLAAICPCAQSQSTPAPQSPAPPAQTASTPQQPAKPAPKKKPEEPIDPDATAGVRGSGTSHTVRVLSRGKPVQSVHVVAKNSNGSLAGACYTNAAGECHIQLGADSYSFNAAKTGLAGTVSVSVDDSTGPIVSTLVKVKTGSAAPKP
jgi:hypothetical protein